MMKKYIIFIIDAYNIRSSICTKELAPSEIQCTDYTDYLLGGNLTLKNGHIDTYQFDEGYCQAEKNISDANKDDFTFCYYDQDHLGNIRQVTKADGSQTGNIVQTINYYPFGMQFCDGTTCYLDQKHKYNGKEFDNMHGLNWYDYGARMYDPALGIWTSVDQLCEKYYNISPYVYCHDNPVNKYDKDGRDDYYDINGNFLSHEDNNSDLIMIRYVNPYLGNSSKQFTPIENLVLSAEAYSNIFTDIISKTSGIDPIRLYNNKVSVVVSDYDNIYTNKVDTYNNPDMGTGYLASSCPMKDGGTRISASITYAGNDVTNNDRFMFSTVSNVRNLLVGHELKGHQKTGLSSHNQEEHNKVYDIQRNEPSWKITTIY